jgi:hypothetical protein
VWAGVSLANCVAVGWIDIRGNRWRKANKVENVPGEEMAALNQKEGESDEIAAADNDEEEDDDDSAGGMLTWEDIKTLPITGWYVFIICTCFYATIFPFVSQGVEFLKTCRDEEDNDARAYTSWILVLSGFGLAPAMGFVIDKYLYNTIWLGAGVAAAGLGHFALRVDL